MTYHCLLLFSCCGLFAACGNVFAPDRNVKEAISDSDVIGTWTLGADSLHILARDGFQPEPSNRYTITLKPGGTLLFASVADDFHHIYPVTADGTWMLEHNTRGDSNVLKTNALKITLRVNGRSETHYLNFARENGTLILWNYYRDPDSWEFLEYTRNA